MGYNGGKKDYQSGKDVPSDNTIHEVDKSPNYPKDSEKKNPTLPESDFCGHKGRSSSNSDKGDSGY